MDQTSPPHLGEEEVLWEGSPSQVIHLKTYVICFLLCWLIVPIFYAVWIWIETRGRDYKLTTQRLQLSTGVLSKRSHDLELYRVRDTFVQEPFLLRMFGVGNIVMHTSDESHPQFTIRAAPDPQGLRDLIRRQVELMRRHKRVREVDFE